MKPIEFTKTSISSHIEQLLEAAEHAYYDNDGPGALDLYIEFVEKLKSCVICNEEKTRG